MAWDLMIHPETKKLLKLPEDMKEAWGGSFPNAFSESTVALTP